MEQNTPTIEQQIANLTAVVNGHQEKISAQAETIATQAATIASLKGSAMETKISTKAEELPKIPKSPVKVNGKNYMWNVPVFQFENQKITAEEASTDEALVARILKVPGQGLLKEQA